MYVRVTKSPYDPAQIANEDAVTLGEAVAAAMKTLPGFVSYQGGSDPETGVLIAISTWQDKNSASFPREALGDVVEKIISLGALPEPPVICEIQVTA